MSVTNAISGVIVVGCMNAMTIATMNGSERKEWEDYSILSMIGLFFASINVFGGFIVTHRMLDMFKL